MNQASPPPVATPGGIPVTGSGGEKRRRMSQVDEGNIIVDQLHRKRKRASAAIDSTYTPAGDENGGEVGPATLATTAPARSPEEFEMVKQSAMILYDKLMSQRDPNNYERFLHEHFLELPDPTIIPEYYEMIKKPVCLNQIKQKLDTLSYSSLLEAKTDMNQIFVNAKRFNARESPLFMDAKKLHKNLKANYAYLIGEAPPPEEDEPSHNNRRNRRASSSVAPGGLGGGGDDGDYVDSGGNASGGGGGGGGGNQKRGPTLKPWLLKKYDQLVRKTDQNGRVLADVFRVLPDKRSWPEYYQYIQHPISLDNILSKANARKYRSVAEFKGDVERSFGNAMFFNEEGSIIWNDAKFLLDHFNEIMKEVPPKFAPPRKYNTARRRAELENAQAEGGNPYSEDQQHDQRSKSLGPNQDEMGGGGGEMSQEEGDSDEGEESDGGGDYSTGYIGGLEGNGFDTTTLNGGFSNPFPSTNGSIPVLDNLSQMLNPTTQQPLPTSIDALTSLANLASSISPQRPSLALPQQPSFNGNANGNGAASSRIGSATVGAFSPKPLARIPSPGEIPLVTSFTISPSTSTTQPSSKIVLDNSQARQHSITVAPSTTRIEIDVKYRRQQFDGSLVSNGASDAPVNVQVEVSSRRAEDFCPIGGGGGLSPSRFTLTPKKGFNVADFTVRTQTGGNDEVYRIFISK
ncbi:bromodomain-containing protein [Sporobolomyces salmoneus]|uniref:bromodomain-containing protein n=1 Tax=Sporobolomyces salmoneus TaxID=183962 RepID=UPI003173EB83